MHTNKSASGDDEQRLHAHLDRIENLIAQGDKKEAYQEIGRLCGTRDLPGKSYYNKVRGFDSYYDYFSPRLHLLWFQAAQSVDEREREKGMTLGRLNRLARNNTPLVRAERQYLRGRLFFADYGFSESKDSLQKAYEAFERALTLNPQKHRYQQALAEPAFKELQEEWLNLIWGKIEKKLSVHSYSKVSLHQRLKDIYMEINQSIDFASIQNDPRFYKHRPWQQAQKDINQDGGRIFEPVLMDLIRIYPSYEAYSSNNVDKNRGIHLELDRIKITIGLLLGRFPRFFKLIGEKTPSGNMSRFIQELKFHQDLREADAKNPSGLPDILSELKITPANVNKRIATIFSRFQMLPILHLACHKGLVNTVKTLVTKFHAKTHVSLKSTMTHIGHKSPFVYAFNAYLSQPKNKRKQFLEIMGFLAMNVEEKGEFTKTVENCLKQAFKKRDATLIDFLKNKCSRVAYSNVAPKINLMVDEKKEKKIPGAQQQLKIREGGDVQTGTFNIPVENKALHNNVHIPDADMAQNGRGPIPGVMKHQNNDGVAIPGVQNNDGPVIPGVIKAKTQDHPEKKIPIRPSPSIFQKPSKETEVHSIKSDLIFFLDVPLPKRTMGPFFLYSLLAAIDHKLKSIQEGTPQFDAIVARIDNLNKSYPIFKTLENENKSDEKANPLIRDNLSHLLRLKNWHIRKSRNSHNNLRLELGVAEGVGSDEVIYSADTLYMMFSMLGLMPPLTNLVNCSTGGLMELCLAPSEKNIALYQALASIKGVNLNRVEEKDRPSPAILKSYYQRFGNKTAQERDTNFFTARTAFLDDHPMMARFIKKYWTFSRLALLPVITEALGEVKTDFPKKHLIRMLKDICRKSGTSAQAKKRLKNFARTIKTLLASFRMVSDGLEPLSVLGAALTASPIDALPIVAAVLGREIDLPLNEVQLRQQLKAHSVRGLFFFASKLKAFQRKIEFILKDSYWIDTPKLKDKDNYIYNNTRQWYLNNHWYFTMGALKHKNSNTFAINDLFVLGPAGISLPLRKQEAGMDIQIKVISLLLQRMLPTATNESKNTTQELKASYYRDYLRKPLPSFFRKPSQAARSNPSAVPSVITYIPQFSMSNI